ncbi:uncharacterized protein VICG_01312 [Vittaforma corneae ATCC 50505]|uniref:Ubiquitin-activating enzyme E1 C-terminal domain-containing protein n=1 Tax=Vittaforma corneae (strain ATCC 50505) TaxID=993615 RepID=L2GM29_VITCO|nr:uncharacterized protein VICG_01312 [Vittaforma corneae ATCC 50505]ELA41679.1 hypothetical protein VICG_01312 [Vittaforma corneae ATCC 50505]
MNSSQENNKERNAKSNGDEENLRVDEELYSRQLYVIGHEAMVKMMGTKVLIIGMDGLGQEIAKNVCLAGIRYVSIYDKGAVTPRSMCSGYYFSRDNLGQQRDSAVLEQLRNLNKYVEIKVAENIQLEDHDIVVSVNQSLEENLRLNDLCHLKGIKFVMANASGLFTQLFCDFQLHTCIDKDGEPASTGVINDITPEGVLTIVEGTHHSFETGNSVKIDNAIYGVSVISRSQFKLEGYSCDKLKIGGDYEQVKIPSTIEFKSLRESLESPQIMDFEFSNVKKPRALHDLFIYGEIRNNFEQKDMLEGQFSKTRGCLIPPVCSVIGGFAAQEVIKAASSKFTPVQQFYYFDCSDAYIENDSNGDESSRYYDMIKLFGDDGFRRIREMKIFLVGAGAIGCENLKNFVCSGIGADGLISVTDMDSIEQSNLNRQFLFRTEDVSKMKSESAVKRVLELNGDYCDKLASSNKCGTPANESGHVSACRVNNITAYTLPVNHENENVFSDKLISHHDLISNALDNVEARAYMDRRCIQMRRPMIDAGTLGTKGHVQVVVPFISESYSSSSDPQEKSIPLCTIKSYPYSIEHTIEWAMSEFKLHFNERVQDAKEYLESKDPGLQDIYDSAPKNVEECLKAALSMFVNSFSTSIQNLLNTFPPDHVDDQGNMFWSPPKKVPSPISFNINDKLHIIFVHSTANLYAECFKVRKISRDEVYAFLENVLSLKEPNPIHFENSNSNFSQLTPLEFDKDSWHVDFVYSAANLRARNYKIKEKSKHFIRGIAGRIIPAIATTTAIVSGLAAIEIIKYATQKEKVAKHVGADLSGIPFRNSYVDLAAPFLASTELVKPKELFYENKGKKIKYTVWSRLEFKDGTLKNIIQQIRDEIGDEVSMVSFGSKVIYWNLCSKYDLNLEKTISELCKKKEGQFLVYLDVLPEKEGDMIDVAIIFE